MDNGNNQERDMNDLPTHNQPKPGQSINPFLNNPT